MRVSMKLGILRVAEVNLTMPVKAATVALESIPKVTNSKLANIVDDLYKGAKTSNPIGSGSTADAIRQEIYTGTPVGGRFHSQKGQQYVNALTSWIRKNPNASANDISTAQLLLNDLTNALRGQ